MCLELYAEMQASILEPKSGWSSGTLTLFQAWAKSEWTLSKACSEYHPSPELMKLFLVIPKVNSYPDHLSSGWKIPPGVSLQCGPKLNLFGQKVRIFYMKFNWKSQMQFFSLPWGWQLSLLTDRTHWSLIWPPYSQVTASVQNRGEQLGQIPSNT